MAQELQPSDTGIISELLRLSEEVRRTQQSRVLSWKDQDVVVTLSPAKQARSRGRGRRTGRITPDDPFVLMAGSGDSGIPGGISGRKYDYFGRAFGVEEPG